MEFKIEVKNFFKNMKNIQNQSLEELDFDLNKIINDVTKEKLILSMSYYDNDIALFNLKIPDEKVEDYKKFYKF